MRKRLKRLLFLASDGVYSSRYISITRLVLKTSIFSLSFKLIERRCVFCCTFRSLTAPSISLASLPAKSRLSSPIFYNGSGCLVFPYNLFMYWPYDDDDA